MKRLLTTFLVVAYSLLAIGCRANIDQQLEFNRNSDGVWVAKLDTLHGEFLDVPITAHIDSQAFREDAPDSDSIKLLNRIIRDLPEIVPICERELKDYQREIGAEFVDHVTNPHIWIDADREDDDSWAFVVERDDWKDYGWHLQFKKSRFVEIWGGS